MTKIIFCIKKIFAFFLLMLYNSYNEYLLDIVTNIYIKICVDRCYKQVLYLTQDNFHNILSNIQKILGCFKCVLHESVSTSDRYLSQLKRL